MNTNTDIENKRLTTSKHPMNQTLNEIIIIRLVLVVCLVMDHSFAPFWGAWKPVTEEFIPLYFWIGKWSYSFFLGSFVFISGYLYAHGEIKKGLKPFWSLAKDKAERLIIPSIVFSILYLICFGRHFDESIGHILYSLLNGRGHMWFLPMLFWLFLATWVLNRIKTNRKVLLIATLVMTILSVIPMPFRISAAFYYLIFFYWGYYIYLIRNKLLNNDKISGGVIVSLIIVYAVIFALAELYDLNNQNDKGLFLKIVIYYSRLVYTLAGTLALYLIAIWLIKKNRITISNGVVKFSSYCFGIYIFQQFILMFLYFHTDLIDKMGVRIAPWIFFLVTLLISTLLTMLALRTRIGRALIG